MSLLKGLFMASNTVLPPVSVQAILRVKDSLPAPTVCPHCESPVRLVNNAEIYGKPYGDWPWAYLCTGTRCRAYVGMHPNTDIPLGTLATAEIRDARKRAKNLFNPIWQGGKMSRSAAYAWLAKEMNIPKESCHFGWFDVAQCNTAIKILTARKG
ncbi:transporter [Novimethylophilus kurashikiensis]|uniref:Transporter n=1 Tax=Novimethylophilus kurashikiensis TaxID=1825523 RepID=A0A2R5F8D5_9PROT|nr:zinc-finger-containing protein [Novimethylophilus kurashikiensis]GBG14457.1 transporter [Novimethylophilus kurashikiensis]